MSDWEKEFEDWFYRTKRAEEFKARYKEVWRECSVMHQEKIKGIIAHIKVIIDTLKTVLK